MLPSFSIADAGFAGKNGKLETYAMKRVAAGAHLPTPWVFGPAGLPNFSFTDADLAGVAQFQLCGRRSRRGCTISALRTPTLQGLHNFSFADADLAGVAQFQLYGCHRFFLPSVVHDENRIRAAPIIGQFDFGK